MSHKQTFLPESFYSIDSDMTLEKISILYKTHTPIVGSVVRLDTENNLFEVHLGKGIKAYMSFSESTIYPIFKSNSSLSSYITSLVGKKIRANILSINDKIFLSRKSNMQNALKTLVHSRKIPYAEITGFSRLSAFLDIGEGLTGRCYGKDYAQTIYHKIQDIGIEEHSLISVEIVNFNPKTKYFDLSRVALLPKVTDKISVGDYVTCKVFTAVDNIGYYVLIDNEFKGILDSEHEQLYYGDIVTAKVKKISHRGPHLRFVDYVY